MPPPRSMPGPSAIAPQWQATGPTPPPFAAAALGVERTGGHDAPLAAQWQATRPSARAGRPARHPRRDGPTPPLPFAAALLGVERTGGHDAAYTGAIIIAQHHMTITGTEGR